MFNECIEKVKEILLSLVGNGAHNTYGRTLFRIVFRDESLAKSAAQRLLNVFDYINAVIEQSVGVLRGN